MLFDLELRLAATLGLGGPSGVRVRAAERGLTGAAARASRYLWRKFMASEGSENPLSSSILKVALLCPNCRQDPQQGECVGCVGREETVRGVGMLVSAEWKECGSAYIQSWGMGCERRKRRSSKFRPCKRPKLLRTDSEVSLIGDILKGVVRFWDKISNELSE